MYSIKVIRGNLVNSTTEAIVNSANNNLMPGYGVNKTIFYAAGDRLIEECAKHPSLPNGKAILTSGFNVTAKYIIHAVGPYWHGGYNDEAQDLASCYISILKIVKELGISSVAIPALCTGKGGYPIDEAIDIAVCSVTSFLQAHNMDTEIWFMCYDQETLLKYRQKCSDGVEDISKYITRKEIKIDAKLSDTEKKLLKPKLFSKIIPESNKKQATLSVLKRVIKKKYPDCVYLEPPKTTNDITYKTCTKYEKSGPFITYDCVQEMNFDTARMQLRIKPFSFVDTPEELESKKIYTDDVEANGIADKFDRKHNSDDTKQKIAKVLNVEAFLAGMETGNVDEPVFIDTEKVNVRVVDMNDATTNETQYTDLETDIPNDEQNSFLVKTDENDGGDINDLNEQDYATIDKMFEDDEKRTQEPEIIEEEETNDNVENSSSDLSTENKQKKKKKWYY